MIERGRQLDSGFECWKDEHHGTNRVFFGLPYLMLHSFSHLLITTVALECGYPASSIRERIYALPGIGYGVLLYTGTSDAEGTLGGLIQVGRRIHEHIRDALALGELCSNDPVCAQHEPQNAHERRFLHGAACHGCLLIAETSCEQKNDFLDRALRRPDRRQSRRRVFRGHDIMTGRFQRISDRDLREIALAIRSGRLSPPYSSLTLQRIVSGDVTTLTADLQWLAQSGFGEAQVARRWS